MFLRKSAHTAAKSRTNLGINSGKATKRLGRLAPNLAHMRKVICEWITPNKLPLETQGGTWGVLGGKQFKSLKKLPDWHQLWFTSADASANRHRLNPSRSSIPEGAFGGGVGVTNSKVLGYCQTTAPIGTKFGTRQRIRLEWT